MTYVLRFLPEVEEDIITGYGWYEAKSQGLGEEFLRMSYACASEIPQNKMVGSISKWWGQFFHIDRL